MQLFGVRATRRRFGLRRPGAAFVQTFNRRGLRQVAGDQSADWSAHSKELQIHDCGRFLTAAASLDGIPPGSRFRQRCKRLDRLESLSYPSHRVGGLQAGRVTAAWGPTRCSPSRRSQKCIHCEACP